jgi:hypothetical protein
VRPVRQEPAKGILVAGLRLLAADRGCCGPGPTFRSKTCGVLDDRLWIEEQKSEVVIAITARDPGCVETPRLTWLARYESRTNRGGSAWTVGSARTIPVRVIDVFVDELDLIELGFSGLDREASGRPSHPPEVLLKLYNWGYLDRARSSRRLEREAGRDVGVMGLTGRLVPDPNTATDVRKGNGRGTRGHAYASDGSRRYSAR